jgi:hypothetical protein
MHKILHAGSMQAPVPAHAAGMLAKILPAGAAGTENFAGCEGVCGQTLARPRSDRLALALLRRIRQMRSIHSEFIGRSIEHVHAQASCGMTSGSLRFIRERATK